MKNKLWFLIVVCGLCLGCSRTKTSEPEAINSYQQHSFWTSNCTFIGRGCGMMASNIEGAVLLGKSLETTNSWTLVMRLKSGRVITYPMPTNDPIDFGWYDVPTASDRLEGLRLPPTNSYEIVARMAIELGWKSRDKGLSLEEAQALYRPK